MPGIVQPQGMSDMQQNCGEEEVPRFSMEVGIMDHRRGYQVPNHGVPDKGRIPIGLVDPRKSMKMN